MKKLSITVILLIASLALFGCQEEKKSACAATWCVSDIRLVPTSNSAPTFRNEYRFLENEQLYYGMEAERSRMAQARAKNAQYSVNTAKAVALQDSF